MAAAFILWAGVTVLIAGTAADLAYHLLPKEVVLVIGLLGPEGHGAHLITLIGMVLVLASLIQRALARKIESEEA